MNIEQIKKDFPDIKVVRLERPAYGYCCMKRVYQLDNPKYKNLPQFASAEEQGRGKPVILRKGNGEEITKLPWDEFHKLYEID